MGSSSSTDTVETKQKDDLVNSAREELVQTINKLRENDKLSDEQKLINILRKTPKEGDESNEQDQTSEDQTPKNQTHKNLKLVELWDEYLITIDDENVGIFDDIKNAEKYVIDYSKEFVKDSNHYLVKIIDDNSDITYKIMGYSMNYLFNYDKVVSTISITAVLKLNYE